MMNHVPTVLNDAAVCQFHREGYLRKHKSSSHPGHKITITQTEQTRLA